MQNKHGPNTKGKKTNFIKYKKNFETPHLKMRNGAFWPSLEPKSPSTSHCAL